MPPTLSAGTDHDLLIELRTEMRGVRSDIRDLKDGTSTTLADHEKRLRDIEDTLKSQDGRKAAFSFVGSAVYGAIGLIAGIVGSLIQAGKL